MPSLLLRTKLHVPRVRRGLVTRPRLSEGWTGEVHPRLTLVSAPAGFGMSCALSDAVRGGGTLLAPECSGEIIRFAGFLCIAGAGSVACSCRRGCAFRP